jgi:hypothetical protein
VRTQRYAAIHACMLPWQLPASLFLFPFPTRPTRTRDSNAVSAWQPLAAGGLWEGCHAHAAFRQSVAHLVEMLGFRESASGGRLAGHFARTNRCRPHRKYDGGSRLTRREERKRESLGRGVDGRSGRSRRPACPVLLSAAKLRAPSTRPSQHPLGTHCPNMRSLPHTLSCCLYDRDAQAVR